jgi:uncharacterized coiled-coil DUF342 family protein
MDEKKAYQEKIEAQLKEASAKIAELAAKADQAKADAKLQYQEQIKTLRTMRDELNRKLMRLNDAGEGAWEDIKKGLDDAWIDLKRSLDSAVSKFK